MFTRTAIISALLAVATAAPLFKSFSGPWSEWTNAISDASSTSDWDYIIAGAGPAGIIVAQRLAEQYKKVLLLEVGGPSTQSSGGNASTTWTSNGLTVYDVPSQQGSIFSTGAAHTCADTPGTAGCLLGGGVEINALVFVKPANHDFDDKWPVGWKWADIEESANALYERNPPTTTPSTDGESYDTAEFDILSSFLDTQSYTQVDATVDTNAKKSAYSRPPWNAINGERAGPVRTYLPLAQNMTNFSLQMYTKVIRVVRDGGKATGVEVEDSNTGARSIISICSSGRIVLAAGSMRTPAILINSGIGPADQIAIVANGTNNITLPDKSDYINLPVGIQIKDHPIVTVIFNTTSDLALYPYAKPTAADQELYLTNRTGVLAQNTQRLIFWDSFVGSDNVTRYIQGTTGPYATNQLSIKFYLTHGSTSIGQLGMSSAGATTFITSPYFQTEADTTGLTNYISSFMSATTLSGILYPSTNETASSLLTTGLSSGTHYVGTAKIGTDDGRKGGEAVVDTNTKVYGMDNLFVVDASIHADLPTGNTQAIVMVVAEKAAQKILALR